VGQCAIALASRAGAAVIATVRTDADQSVAARAGAHQVITSSGLTSAGLLERVRAEAPEGIDHVIEVALDRNVWLDEPLLRQGGSIAAYATGDPTPAIPFWPLLFKNVRLFFLGSDDFPLAAKLEAAHALNEALESGWPGFEIGARFPLESIAQAHLTLEGGNVSGRIVLG
jgi:NADPH2:quinone reductase